MLPYAQDYRSILLLMPPCRLLPIIWIPRALKKIVNNFVSLVNYCEGNTAGIESELFEIGIKQLGDHAGVDYKRAIVRALALNSVERIGF